MEIARWFPESKEKEISSRSVASSWKLQFRESSLLTLKPFQKNRVPFNAAIFHSFCELSNPFLSSLLQFTLESLSHPQINLNQTRGITILIVVILASFWRHFVVILASFCRHFSVILASFWRHFDVNL